MNNLTKYLSGYESVDELVNFRSGSTYIVAGYKKSGKSSFLLGIAHHLLEQKNKLTYFDTELSDDEFYSALSARIHDIPKLEAEENEKLKNIAKTSYTDYLTHYDPTALSVSDMVDFGKTMNLAKKQLEAGCRIFIFDNITTYMGNPKGKEQGWQVLQACATTIKDFAKVNNVLCLVVVHTRDTIVFNETPQGIRKLVEDDTAQQIFDKSITVIKKPSAQDIYGGSSYQGQMAGTILVWRPYQLYDLRPDLQGLTQIILEDFRHYKGGSARFNFDGAKGIFTEDLISMVLEHNK